MSLLISQNDEKEFEIVPAGVYTARCYQVIDFGTQKVTWMGNDKLQRKGNIAWEILDDKVKMEDGRPFSVSKRYTLSMFDQGQLYKDLVSWRGRPFTDEELQGFNISNVLGAYATIQIIHNKSDKNGKTYANVDVIMQLKGAKPEGINPDKLLELDIDNFNDKTYESLPEWMREMIAESPEYQNIMANRTPKENTKDIQILDMDEAEQIDLDDIPF